MIVETGKLTKNVLFHGLHLQELVIPIEQRVSMPFLSTTKTAKLQLPLFHELILLPLLDCSIRSEQLLRFCMPICKILKA
jgi:hypothetical protein